MCKSVVMLAKKERKPEPPRPSKPRRPVTADQRREQMSRFPIMPDKFAPVTDNFPVKTPQLRPDQAMI